MRLFAPVKVPPLLKLGVLGAELLEMIELFAARIPTGVEPADFRQMPPPLYSAALPVRVLCRRVVEAPLTKMPPPESRAVLAVIVEFSTVRSQLNELKIAPPYGAEFPAKVELVRVVAQ